MRARSLARVPLVFALGFALQHCVGSNPVQIPPDVTPPVVDAGDAGDDGGSNPDAVGATTASKVDVLLVVDNSASMGDKAEVLAGSIGTLVRKVAPVGDVHLGVISSSLGSMGGDVCSNNLGGPPDDSRNQLAHLRTTARDGTVVAAAKERGFLSFGGGASTDVDAFLRDAESLVRGVGQSGCGLEAQLESAYRFLVQPDPWKSVTLDAKKQAQYDAVDGALLAQRAAFLRPDSLVVVVLLTDEDDSSVNPRAIGGQGWAYANNQFPGSSTFRADGKTTTAPRGTSACATDPNAEDCTSCGLAATCIASDPKCQAIKNDPECQKNGGYYGPNEDSLNVRFHRMKERFGVDPQFPLQRYTDGLTKVLVPNRDGEHETVDGVVSPYVGQASCTNPLFAASLPVWSDGELCKLPRGPRGKELVLFAVIGGVPEGLVAGGSPNWTAILGASPETNDASGIDPHMVPSTAPRNGVPTPTQTRGDNGDPSDPVGRDWITDGDDLQYACTFELPSPRTCTAQEQSCDCAGPKNPPLCAQTLGTQLKAKAYPSIRPLRVAKALGDRGLAASICPRNVTTGYAATLSALGDRIAPRLAK